MGKNKSLRKIIKRLIVIILLMGLVGTCLDQHNKIRELKRNRDQAKTDLITFYSLTTYPVSYVFSRVKK